MFNMCYGGIYLPRGEKQDDEDGDGNVYKKEILYGKQYDYWKILKNHFLIAMVMCIDL